MSSSIHGWNRTLYFWIHVDEISTFIERRTTTITIEADRREKKKQSNNVRDKQRSIFNNLTINLLNVLYVLYRIIVYHTSQILVYLILLKHFVMLKLIEVHLLDQKHVFFGILAVLHRVHEKIIMLLLEFLMMINQIHLNSSNIE